MPEFRNHLECREYRKCREILNIGNIATTRECRKRRIAYGIYGMCGYGLRHSRSSRASRYSRFYQSLLGFVHRLVGPLHCIGRFGRHIVFIVLGEYFRSGKDAVSAELALCDDTFSFLEQIRKDTGKRNRHTLRRISNDETHDDAIGLTLDAAFFNQPSDAEIAALRRLMRRDLRGGEKEHQIAAKGIQHHRRRETEDCQASDDERHALVSWLHPRQSVRGCMRTTTGFRP